MQQKTQPNRESAAKNATQPRECSKKRNPTERVQQKTQPNWESAAKNATQPGECSKKRNPTERVQQKTQPDRESAAKNPIESELYIPSPASNQFSLKSSDPGLKNICIINELLIPWNTR